LATIGNAKLYSLNIIVGIHVVNLGTVIDILIIQHRALTQLFVISLYVVEFKIQYKGILSVAKRGFHHLEVMYRVQQISRLL